MSPLLLVVLASVGAVLLAGVQRAVGLILEKEYSAWAPGLARLLVRVAGLICRPRRGQWWADLLYMQKVNSQSGLVPAVACFISAPWLGVRYAMVRAMTGTWYSYPAGPKRLIDVLLAGAVLLATLPVWLAIVVAIRLDSPGPAVLAQDRVGLHGRRFRFYKFRSITNGVEGMNGQLGYPGEMDGLVFAPRADARVTRVGRFLRFTALDELPLILNVLKGEMSLVGPWPAVPEDVAQYRPSDTIRLAVKPGLTCWWQVRGAPFDFDTWMAYDRAYVHGLSVWVDIRILFHTLCAVLRCDMWLLPLRAIRRTWNRHSRQG